MVCSQVCSEEGGASRWGGCWPVGPRRGCARVGVRGVAGLAASRGREVPRCGGAWGSGGSRCGAVVSPEPASPKGSCDRYKLPKEAILALMTIVNIVCCTPDKRWFSSGSPGSPNISSAVLNRMNRSTDPEPWEAFCPKPRTRPRGQIHSRSSFSGKSCTTREPAVGPVPSCTAELLQLQAAYPHLVLPPPLLKEAAHRRFHLSFCILIIREIW